MRSPQNRAIYFDYNATHPPLTDIIRPTWDEYQQEFFNPSGASRFSLSNQGKIEEARKFFRLNDDFNLDGHIFSSTGTEANYNMFAALKNSYPDLGFIYTSPSEHSSFYSAMEYFGFRKEEISTDKSGQIHVEELEEKMARTPAPIGIIYAGNETGILQPVEEISKIAKKYNMPFIADCMQAFGKILIDYSLLDGYTCSGHKIGAGPGASLTALRSLKPSSRFIQGGNQENGFRAGTENLPAIQAFAQVARFQLDRLGGTIFNNLMIRRRVQNKLKELGAEIVGESSPRLPNTVFAILPLEDLDFFMMGMEERQILISTGSSCKSRAREASRTLLKMGYSEEEALRAIRISWGSETTENDVDILLEAVEEVLAICG